MLPTASAALRGDRERWFDTIGVRPRVVGQFDDSALLKVFGQAGVGAFVAPKEIAREIARSPTPLAAVCSPTARDRAYGAYASPRPRTLDRRPPPKNLWAEFCLLGQLVRSREGIAFSA